MDNGHRNAEFARAGAEAPGKGVETVEPERAESELIPVCAAKHVLRRKRRWQSPPSSPV